MQYSEPRTFADTLLLEISYLLSPLKRVTNGPSTHALLRDLGWELPSTGLFPNGLGNLSSDVSNLITTVYQIADAATSEDYLDLIMKLKDSIVSVVGIMGDADNLQEDVKSALRDYTQFARNSGIVSELLPERLLDYLLHLHLQSRHPSMYAMLTLVGLVEVKEVTTTQSWEPSTGYTLRTVHWDRLTTLFIDPVEIVERIYGWGSNLDANLFLSRLELVLRCFLIPGGLYQQDSEVHAALNPDSEENREIRIPLHQGGQWPTTYEEAGLSVAPLEGAKPGQKGLALLPYLVGMTEIAEDLSPQWEVKMKGSLDLQGGVGLLIRPRHELTLATKLYSSRQDPVDARLEFALTRIRATEGPVMIFDLPQASSLGFCGLGIRILAEKTQKRADELGIEFEINRLTLVVDTSGGDGFLQKLLSGITVESVCDLAIGWSSLDGVRFRGSGALKIVIPVYRSLGPVDIEAVHILIDVDGGFEIAMTVSLGAVIGPVAASIEQIGLQIPITFPKDRRGNLGPVRVGSPSFVPPLGAGLAISADPISGGGSLRFDPENKRYDGILQLKAAEIGLTAIGLITTGANEYSMLVMISVEFTPPIQLSFGFTLSAVGGLIGINRTMALDVLRAGFRNRTLNSILFPRDPVKNAARIISDLRAVFPPKEGRFVVGPVVRIGWGSPTMITAELAVIIELPMPTRILILGQFEAAFPTRDKALVELHLDVLGSIDFAKQLLTIDATLYDSHVLVYTLSGDAALRLKWGRNPVFALSLGGFHPKFTRPPDFPDLRRLSLSIGKGNNPRLNCDEYKALTSNSLQFGAKVELRAKACGASVRGHLGFDALFYFSPFHFVVSISGGVTVRFKGHKLASIRLRLELSGPAPWNAQGTAKFEILFWDVKFHFNVTWGSRSSERLAVVDPWDEFVAALERPESWSTFLPPTRSIAASLRSLDDAAEAGSTSIVVHPAGRLEVRQNVLPLGVWLDRYGNAPISPYHVFDLELKAPEGQSAGDYELRALEGFFARGQYEDLSDSEKVSKPSYELFREGVAIESKVFDFGAAEIPSSSLEYESEYIDEEEQTIPSGAGAMLMVPHIGWLLRGAASRRNLLRTTGRHKYACLGEPAKVEVLAEQYTIVDTKELKTKDDLITQYGTASALAGWGQSDRHGRMTCMEADRILRTAVADDPSREGELQVVLLYEVG